MAQPDFTIADVLAWARTKPADERYDVTNASACALGQFGTATERGSDLHHCWDPDKELGFVGLNKALGFDRKVECTFGALVARLEALLPAEPISDMWTRSDAYMADIELASA